MSFEPLQLFDPRRTIQIQGFSGRAATTTLHDATETGFQISGIYQAAEDFANVQLFSAYDYFNHLRLKPLPVKDLSALTLQYDMEILPVNGEEGNVRRDCVRYASERRLRSARHPVPSVCRLRPGVDVGGNRRARSANPSDGLLRREPARPCGWRLRLPRPRRRE
jgi:hypothetical protein